MVTRYQNGDRIPNITDNTEWSNLSTGAWYYYNNVASNDRLYGKFYHWYAVAVRRGLCPEGWRVLSDSDWTVLVNYLGCSSVAGGKLKSTRTEPDAHPRWRKPNEGATNESGFSGLPAAYRSSAGTYVYIYGYIGYYGYWWSSTESDANLAYNRYLNYNLSFLGRHSYIYKQTGNSVRCMKD